MPISAGHPKFHPIFPFSKKKRYENNKHITSDMDPHSFGSVDPDPDSEV